MKPGIAERIKPTVGMGVTIHCYPDKKAATVIAIAPDGKTAEVQLDNARRLDEGYWHLSESQFYEYTRNPDGQIHQIYLTESGYWSGAWRVQGEDDVVSLDIRHAYCKNTDS